MHTQVPLGILPHNEVKTEEMIKILDELHRYVPRCSDKPEKVQQVAFGGDALTAIRARQGINVRVNSSDSVTALRGMVPFSADWHTKVNFISVNTISHTNSCRIHTWMHKCNKLG